MRFDVLYLSWCRWVLPIADSHNPFRVFLGLRKLKGPCKGSSRQRRVKPCEINPTHIVRHIPSDIFLKFSGIHPEMNDDGDVHADWLYRLPLSQRDLVKLKICHIHPANKN